MIQLTLTISHNHLNFVLEGTNNATCKIAITDVLTKEWQYCIDTYESIKSKRNNATLLTLGNSLLESIYNEQSRIVLDQWLQPSNPRILSIMVDSDPSDHEEQLLSLPWELLATSNSTTFLAEDTRCLFEIVRRIGKPSQNPRQPQYKDLTMAFMASDPSQDGGLSYEAEENAIYLATKNIKNLTLVVNDTGNLQLLSDQLYEDIGGCDVLHLSCHGGKDNEGFFLHMEDYAFGAERVTAQHFQSIKPQINTLFLSACHSAGFADTTADSQQKQCMLIDMVVMGIANVVGWDGSVGDKDATEFASHFYQQLQRGNNLTQSCAIARRALLQNKFDDWHLARSFCGADGNQPLVDSRQVKRIRRKITSCYKKLDELIKKCLSPVKKPLLGVEEKPKKAF